MRYLLGSLCVVSLLISPLGASAQTNEEASPPPNTANGHPAQPADTQAPIRGVQRWHPEAFVAPEGAEGTEFQVEYVPPKVAFEYTQPMTPEERQRYKRRRNIAVGVVVPVVLIAIGVGVGMAVTAPMRNWEW